uniref:Uncharacterized protein n=1 Tax=Anguilla anguilla TaxID=7936 RepID=A0A0E9V2U6_ANGAN
MVSFMNVFIKVVCCFIGDIIADSPFSFPNPSFCSLV